MPGHTMKSIALNQQQARVLRDTGELVVFDVIGMPQGEWLLEALDEQGVVFQDATDRDCHLNTRCPFAPGERLRARPCGWHSVNPPRHSMRKQPKKLVLTTASVEPARIQDVSEEDFLAAGVWRVNPSHEMWKFRAGDDAAGLTAGQAYRPLWDAAHPKPEDKFDANPWCWKRVLEVEVQDE